ncbi:MAG: glycosyltransferase family 39 protein [Acidimicrobiales bacterium]
MATTSPGRVAGAPPTVRPAFRRDRVVVAALVVLALILRAPNLGRAYWIDEGISVGIASHPLSQLPHLLGEDGSPPLFYALLHFWIRVFGTSEVATHVFPLLCSLAAVPLAYWAGKDIFDRRAGLAGAALLATSPFLGWYSTETRMYPLVVVLSIVGVTFAMKAVRDRRRRDAVWAIVAFTALLYTHDWGLYLFAVTAGVFLALALARRDRGLAVGVLAAGAATLALWAPWIPTFMEQARNTAAPWAVRPQIGDFFADPASALGGTLAPLIAPLLAAGAWYTRRRRPIGDGQLAGVLCAIGVLTAVVGFLGAQIEPSWTIRYLAVIVAPLLLAAAGALASSREGRAVVIATCALLAGWSVIGTLLPNPNARYAKSNVAAVAAAAAPALQRGDVVVVTQTEQVAVLAHYLPRGLHYVTPTGPVADPYVVNWRNIVPRLVEADPCSAVAPSINSLPVGAHVLLVNPDRQLGAAGTVWYKAVSAQVIRDDYLLAADRSLVPVRSYAEATHPRPYAPVVAELYRKIAGTSTCS